MNHTINPFYFHPIECLTTSTGRRMWPVRGLETLGLSVSNTPRWLIKDEWYVTTPDLVALLDPSSSDTENPLDLFRRHLIFEALEPLEEVTMPPHLFPPDDITSECQTKAPVDPADEDVVPPLSLEDFAAWMLDY